MAWLMILLCIALTTCPQEITGAKILALFPFPGKSHMPNNFALVNALAKRGHDLTVYSPYPEKKQTTNYTHIDLNYNLVDILPQVGTANVYELQKMNYHETILLFWKVGNALCEKALQDEVIQKLIHSTDLKFDVVVVEPFVMECFVGFAHKFKAPLVQLVAFVGAGFMETWMGNPHPVSYVPDPFLEITDRMTFVERLKNSFGEMFQRISREIMFIPKQNSLMKKYFNYTDDMPHLSDILESTSLLMLNCHFSINYPKPQVPNVIHIGGMHIQTPNKLPKDLQDYLDNAPDGVIYFSLGSNWKSSDLPEYKRKVFLDAFSKLKQKVLWKWETDSLPGKPDNVKVGKWLPQTDILAHPNVRLFITHGGLMSSQETIARGIPIVGIPFFADQRLNLLRARKAGYAVMIEYDDITSESLLSAIHEVLDNPRYKENAQRLSRIYLDQPLPLLDQAVYWTEYVIRHKGAPHMRSAALDLTWYQYFLLDVIAVLTLTVCSVLLIMFLVLRAMFRKICGDSKNKSKTTTKKKHN